VRQAYNKAIDLKIITPFMVLIYVKFLQNDCSLFEESYRIFERAIEMFPWPHKYEQWLLYLNLVVSRFRDTKVERIRELF
jgi:pre-mRNA-splicing factor SYF1